MKVYLNCYKNHWISPFTIVDYLFFWTDWSKCSRSKDFIDNAHWIESPKWADNLAKNLEWLSKSIQWVWDKVDRKIDYVKIDRWDTWSADYTLSHIIAPLLRELKEHKQGYGWIADEDVPEELRSTAPGARDGCEEWDWDHNAEARYDWVLDEMIWAFDVKTDDEADSKFFDHSESQDPNDDLNTQLGKLKVDREGLKAFEQRKSNGYRLFGRYYETLWT